MQRFSEEEAQEILRRAVRAPIEDYTSDDLQRSAAELGISPEALARAESEVRAERGRAEFDRLVRSHTRESVVTFAWVNAMLAAINLITYRQHLWFLYVLAFWGLALAMSIAKARNRQSEGYRKAFEMWRETDGKLSKEAVSEIISMG